MPITVLAYLYAVIVAKAAQGLTSYIRPFWLRNFDEAVDFEEGGSLELRVQPEVFVLEGGKKTPPFAR